MVLLESGHLDDVKGVYVKCVHCGTKFSKFNLRKKYCSNYCRVQHYNTKYSRAYQKKRIHNKAIDEVLKLKKLQFRFKRYINVKDIEKLKDEN